MRFFLAALLVAALSAMSPSASAQAASKAAADNHQRAAVIVQNYEPDPALWLLQDEDTRIFLLGTVHVLPRRFRWRSARLDGIVAEADELIVESRDDPEEEASLARLLGPPGKRPRVSEMLGPANRRKWLALGKSMGVAPEEFDRLPPVLAMLGLAASLGSQETQSVAEYGVETVLEAEFEMAGKPIGAIESGTAVLGSLMAIDQGLLIKQLDRDLSLWDGESLFGLFTETSAADVPVENSPLAEEHAWARGQEVDISGFFDETAFSQTLRTLLLNDRNRAWAAWLEQRLGTPGTVLVAVGAAHLAGDNSLQDMLSERGLLAERLN